MPFDEIVVDGVKLQTLGEKVFINNILVKSPPNYRINHKAIINNGVIYLDGYQWVNNTWKRTLKSTYYYLFK